MEKIGLFCSASDSIDGLYFEKARELGEWIGRQHKTLVYGGATLGLMECTAQAVRQYGGRIIGVVPSKLEENGKVSDLPDQTYRTATLSDRKEIMLAQSDVLVALPGGVGTFDEIFHVMAASSIGYHSKKIIFYNIGGFYDQLLAVLGAIYRDRFARHPLNHYFDVASTFTELIDLLTLNDNDRIH